MLSESCFHVVHSNNPPPHLITTFTQASPPYFRPQVREWQFLGLSPSFPSKVPHPLLHQDMLESDPPPTHSPVSLDSGLLPSLSCSAEQCLLIGGWEREGSLGSIYRVSLVYQNNNNPPPHQEREWQTDFWFHISREMCTLGHTLSWWKRWLPIHMDYVWQW